ncbi:MAG TPA: M1 family metallopeptidase, partial [Ferruginibacter sp.]|nr:M1 family metallopeptidase [Ferruginibacter sp.]
TLREILFKLYPNLYKKGAARASNISPEDVSDGVNIESISSNQKLLQPTAYRIDATNMSVRQQLLPKGKIEFEISYSYTLNKGSHIRTGEIEDGAYFIAYFFPRIAVYDDNDGWSRAPYIGSYEFYNDFCDFDISYTIPGDYIAWSTGDLQNAADLFTPKYLSRIRQAETKDDYITIIDSTDIALNDITKQKGSNTWKFKASHVPDVAFAISNHYMWQSTSLVVDQSTGRRTRVDAVFNPKHRDYWLVLADARKTVEAMSYRFPRWPFPYSHETVFDGLDQMEYPMMVNDNPVEDRAESIELTDHEIFHTMFPFYMGTNEIKYAWMDEGWATIGEWLVTPMIDSSIVDLYGVFAVEQTAGKEIDLPISTLTTHITGTTAFINNYPKPAMGYLFVKDMLGDELFYKGLHNYFRNWNGKHPLPLDFFNSMNAGTGKNLNWFWNKWFYENGLPDLAIGKLTGVGNSRQVMILLKGAKPVPVDLTIAYKDGTFEKVHRTIAAWEKGNTVISIKITSSKPIKSLTIGSSHVPDVNKNDNVWVSEK